MMMHPRVVLLLICTLLCVLQNATSRTVCRDRSPSCRLWARQGECYRNIGYMYIHCAESCHQCQVQDDLCSNHNEQCPAWAAKGECTKNLRYMKKTCARACGHCLATNSHDVPHIHNHIREKYWDKLLQG